MSSQAFHEIRAILQRPPSEEAWTRLRRITTRALARHPQEVQEVWLPYLDAGLRRWPGGLRITSQDWLERLCAEGGEGFALWPMIRHLDLTPAMSINLHTLWSRVDTTQLTHLTSGVEAPWERDWSNLEQLIWCTHFTKSFTPPLAAQTPRLHHLTLRDTAPAVLERCEPALLAQLTTLEAQNDHDYASFITSFAQNAARLPNLRHVIISSTHTPDPMSVPALIEHLPPTIAHLTLSPNYHEHTRPQILRQLTGLTPGP